jgi:hypothetical protein
MRANEPVVIHHSSFGEGMGGGFNSFRTNKINKNGGPINPAEGISLFAGIESKEGMGINSLSLPC